MMLERFPKSGNRFLDKKRGKNKELERFAEPSEAKTALDISSQERGRGFDLCHRLPAGYKLICLLVVSVALFYWPLLWFIALVLAVILSLYWLAGFSPLTAFRRAKMLFFLMGMLFIFSVFHAGPVGAGVIVLRLVCLFFLANLVTLTTPLSVMMACFERFFIILKPFGLHPRKVALVFSLTLRFIPLLNRLVAEVRQAQAARGLERSFVAIFIPVIIAMLKMSEEIAEALEARGYDT